MKSGRSWNRTSLLLHIREVLGLLSYPPMSKLRDKDSNLDLHVQSVTSFR